MNQHIALTRPFPNKVLSRWLAYCLLSQVGQSQFGLLLYGGTKDGLGLDDVRNLVVILPSGTEQQRIVSFLDQETKRIDDFCARIGTRLPLLDEYRTALISAAVTGKIDVREETA